MRNVPATAREWHSRAVCPVCGWHAPALDGTHSSAPKKCRQCGAELTLRWRITTMRWVSRAIWSRPWTWGSGRWEISYD